MQRRLVMLLMILRDDVCRTVMTVMMTMVSGQNDKRTCQ